MEPFKNLLGIEAAKKIARAVARVEPKFSSKLFLHQMQEGLSSLELKERMVFLTNRLAEQLANEPSSFQTLVNALKKNETDQDGLSGFLVWPLTHFVALYGLNDFETSLAALREMTKVFTAEFAVRPFFLKDEEYMLKKFKQWTRDENEHVRRLVSEGSRPLLPWGQKLPNFLLDPNKTWPLLIALKDDQSRYVQKSVANHMNDLSKEHGDWLVNQLRHWPNPWVVRHGVRTLVKNGHKGALKIIGVEPVRLKVKEFGLEKSKIKVGEKLVLNCSVANPLPKSITTAIDVKVYFLRSKGQHNVKVFKGKKIRFLPKEKQTVQLKIPLKQVTTRKYHSGQQFVSLLVNGSETTKLKFQLRL